jgi:hypothetical protein
MSPDLHLNPAKPLQTLSAVLRMDAAVWESREELEQIRIPSISIQTERAAQLELEHFSPLIEAYGAALHFRFLLGEEIVLEVDQTIDENKITNFRQAITGAREIHFSFQLDKSQLATLWFGELFSHCDFSNRLILYLYPNRLERFLIKSNLKLIEERFWDDHWQERIVFLVPGMDVFIYGGHLLLLGGKFLNDPPAQIFDNKLVERSELQRIQAECQDTLKWQALMSVSLTPWHLYLSEAQNHESRILNGIRVHFTNLALMYTADRTILHMQNQNKSSYQSTYSTSQQSIEIDLPTPEEIDISTTPQKNYDALLQMIQWAYDPDWKPSDRLAIVQLTIVDALRGSDPAHRYRLLVENAPTILENINWHWKAFAEEKIEGYWDQVRDLENYVSDTVNNFSDQISNVVSKLTETVLAAVAVLLGSFIAALFQEKFNPTVFRIGLISYVLYVLFFPLIYNMRHQWETYQAVIEEFKGRKHRFEKRLPKEKVEEIVGESLIDENKQRFKRWFWYSVGIYIALIILAIIAGIFIPGVFGSPQIVNPLSIPTVVFTPTIMSVAPTPVP